MLKVFRSTVNECQVPLLQSLKAKKSIVQPLVRKMESSFMLIVLFMSFLYCLYFLSSNQNRWWLVRILEAGLDAWGRCLLKLHVLQKSNWLCRIYIYDRSDHADYSRRWWVDYVPTLEPLQIWRSVCPGLEDNEAHLLMKLHMFISKSLSSPILWAKLLF